MTLVLSRKTGRARRAFLRDERSARSLVRVVRKTFKAEAAAVRRAAGGTSWEQALTGAISAVDQKRWIRTLEIIYTEAAASDIWKDTQEALGVTTDDDPRQVVLNHVGPAISTKAAGIRQTTINSLRRLERPPLKASEGGLMRRAAAGLYQKFGRNRAARIAITETLQAAATVQHLAAKSVAKITQATIMKVWESVGDGVVRETHIVAHGQRRLLDEPFDVGFAMLDHPRDPYGPAEEVANCRCWTVHEKVGGASEETGAVTFQPERPGDFDPRFERLSAARAEMAEADIARPGILERFRERRTYRKIMDRNEAGVGDDIWASLDEAATLKFKPPPGGAPETAWKRSVMQRQGEKLAAEFDDEFLALAEHQLRNTGAAYSEFTNAAGSFVPIEENIAANLTKTWATTSGDGNRMSLSLQRRLAKFFDSDWPPPGYQLTDYSLEGIEKVLIAEGGGPTEISRVLDAFIRNVYDDTQALLRSVSDDALGVDAWPMFRGGDFGNLSMRMESVVENAVKPAARQVPLSEFRMNILDEDLFQFFDDFHMNPGSSFSLDAEKANEFAADLSGSSWGQVLWGDVPIEKIWSTPFTGPGCLSESEMIVAAGTTPDEFTFGFWRHFAEAGGF